MTVYSGSLHGTHITEDAFVTYGGKNMQKQQFLVTIVVLIAVIAGILLYAQKHPTDESLGQKVGNTIDRATGERK